MKKHEAAGKPTVGIFIVRHARVCLSIMHKLASSLVKGHLLHMRTAKAQASLRGDQSIRCLLTQYREVEEASDKELEI